jgi:hypothetical protein
MQIPAAGSISVDGEELAVTQEAVEGTFSALIILTLVDCLENAMKAGPVSGGEQVRVMRQQMTKRRFRVGRTQRRKPFRVEVGWLETESAVVCKDVFSSMQNPAERVRVGVADIFASSDVSNVDLGTW